MYTLLIYELVPEETHLYLIPNDILTSEDKHMLEMSHNNIINYVIMDDETKDQCLTLSTKLKKEWEKYKVYDGVGKKDAIKIKENITNIYISGFGL